MNNFTDLLLRELIIPFKFNIELLQKIFDIFIVSIIIILIGLIIAKIVYLVIFYLLKLIRFDAILDFIGLYQFLDKHLKEIPTRIIAKLFYWLIVLLFVTIAVNRTGIDMVKELNDFLRIVPSLLALITILIFSLFLGSVMGKIIELIFSVTGYMYLKFLPLLFGVLFLLIALPFSLALIDIEVETTNSLLKLTFETVIIATGLAIAFASIDYFKNIIFYFRLKSKIKTGDTIIYNNEKAKVKKTGLCFVEIYLKQGVIFIENKEFIHKEIIKEII